MLLHIQKLSSERQKFLRWNYAPQTQATIFNKPKEQVISFLQWFSSIIFFKAYFKEKVITNRNAFVEEFCNGKNKSLLYHMAVKTNL